MTHTKTEYRREILRDDFTPTRPYATMPIDWQADSYPYKSTDVRDRELLQHHYGCPVAELSPYGFQGRTFAMDDGTTGRLK